MLNIHLHGRLGKMFGREWTLAVRTPAEAIRAIGTLKPEFLKFLGESAHTVYRLTIDSKALGGIERLLTPAQEEMHIYPIPEGSKSGGLEIILGVVLIAAAVVTGGGSLASLSSIGSTFTGGGFAGFTAMLGASMVFAGIAQLMTRTTQDNPNFGFPGFNGGMTSRQGDAVPVGYGRLTIPAKLISSGVVSSIPYSNAVVQGNPVSVAGQEGIAAFFQ